MPFSIAGPASPALPSLDGINRATDRISSGLKIDHLNTNNISPNSAEAAISGRFDMLIGESTVNIKNAINQTSALQKADQTLGQGKELVQRIQELTVRSENSVLSETDQSAIAQEISSLFTQVEDLLDQVEFDDQHLFGGNSVDISGLKEQISPLDSDNADLANLEELQDGFTSLQTELGAEQNAIQQRIEATTEYQLSANKSFSQISDADIASEVAKLIQEQINFEASVKVFSHQRLAEVSIINLLN